MLATELHTTAEMNALNVSVHTCAVFDRIDHLRHAIAHSVHVCHVCMYCLEPIDMMAYRFVSFDSV